MPYFTISQIEMFFSVVEMGSLSEAARELYISQPALSKTLSRLETSLGVRLFDRSFEGMTLTREGSFLYSHFKASHSTLTSAIEKARDMQLLTKRVLHIGCHSAYDYAEEFEPLRSAVEKYRRMYPDIQVLEEIMEYRELRSYLLAGEMDIIFSVSFALKNMPDTTTRRVCKKRWGIAVPESHRLCGEERLAPSMLSGETFIFISPEDSQIDKSLNLERCAQLGFTPGDVIYVRNATSLLRAVEQGKGLAFSGEIKKQNGIKVFNMPELPNPAFVTAAWRTNYVTPEAKKLVELLPKEKQELFL